MKYIFYIGIFLSWPLMAFGQDSINPYNTQLPCNIILHNTNVYYNPVDTPASYDTRAGLSGLGDILLDSNGLGDQWPYYEPITHGVFLKNYNPHHDGDPFGFGRHWQRLFTARRKADGSTSDIIAGGDTGDRVIISANEDVDFRASGRIKLKNGFHAKPGCFFHAYTEPKWGDTVFSDDLTSLNSTKWHVSSGANEDYATTLQCSIDSNVFDTLDPDAIDGHALDIIIRMDSCQCSQMLSNDEFDSCRSIIDPSDTVPFHATFSSANLRACPWPFLERDTLPLVPAYQHMPYGKFEIREKIPQFAHHLNDWFNGTYEIDINESNPATPNYLFPNFHQARKYGPLKGMFHKAWTGRDSIIFVSHPAQWSWTNAPQVLFIDNIPYGVSLNYPTNNHDTLRKDPRYLTWPTSLSSDTTDSVTFYYARYSGNGTDSITWSVKQDSHGKWRKLYAPYRISGTDTFRFSKVYQPMTIILTADTVFHRYDTLHCHWEYNLNHPIDSGIIYLDDTMSPSDLHTFKEPYSYTINEGTQVMPAIPFNLYDSMGGYTYHTFSVEILPHEMRYLMDSNVVFRFPDRMIPPGNPSYDPVFDRTALELWIAEADSPDSASFAQHAAAGWPGFRDVNGHHAAHRLIDYIRYWDVPADVKIPNFPH